MAKTRKGQQQPFRKGTGRQPGAPLSAALAGRAAPGVASGVMDHQRTLARNAGKLSDALQRELPRGAAVNGNRAIPKPPAGGAAKMPVAPVQGAQRAGLAGALTAPPIKGQPAAPVGGGASSPQRRKLAEDLQASRQATRAERSARERARRSPAPGSPLARERAYLNGGNTRMNKRTGEEFREFTVKGKQGVYHEYVNPDTGERKVRRVRKAVQTA
jgi:hypothetical protein